MRARGLNTRVKLLPLALWCLAGPVLASGLQPLVVSPDLVRSAVTPRSVVPPSPPSSASQAGETVPTASVPVIDRSRPAADSGVADRSSAGPEAEAARAVIEGASGVAVGAAEVPAAFEPGAAAQTGPEPALATPPVEGRTPGAPESSSRLPDNRGLNPNDTAVAGEAGRTEVTALRITGVRAVELVAEGEAELTRDDTVMTADRLVYNELTDEARAEGNVVLFRGDDRMTGDWARLIVHEWVGEIEAPTYAFTRESRVSDGDTARSVSGSGQADAMLFEGENQYRLQNATWTTCEPESLDWYIKATDLELDYDRQVGVARGASVVFKDVPILWWPKMSFPLAEQRQSGFLVPTVGASNKTGFDVAVPYYWNIAPNYDATVTPRFMGRRGLQLGGEVRYLQPNYSGEIRAEWLPEDRDTGEARSLGAFQHVHRITPRLHASLDYNWVSDDQYFEDLSTRISVASRVNLLREGRMTYHGGWWTASALAQGYQTLSGSEPYRRLPQLTLNAYRADLPAGLAFTLGSEYANFKHENSALAEGSRLHVYPQLALPIEQSAFFITPKIGLHSTRYDLDRPLEGGSKSIRRNLPIFSIDSGLYFEREASFFGQDYVQTLEPRFFYVRTPYEDQRDIPRFDTGRFDFGFAQLFTENRYSGVDRVGDANELTVAVTSRFIEPGSGAERLRATVGQQFYFDDQRVTLNQIDEENRGVFIENPRVKRRTDIIGALSGRVTKATTIDTFLRYNPFESQTERFNFGVRYQPEFGKNLNFSYRFARDLIDGDRPGLEDLDLSAQWPLGNRWYGVGRVTRSIKENRITESVAGVEYISTCGCWVFRTAAHRFATDPNRVTNALFVQLELTGLGGIGASPVNLLTRSVPGYGKINEPMSNRFFGED